MCKKLISSANVRIRTQCMMETFQSFHPQLIECSDSISLFLSAFNEITESLRINLRDPISLLPLSCPCRFVSCKHLSCFDFFSYKQIVSISSKNLKCPICSVKADFSEIYQDFVTSCFVEIFSDTQDFITIFRDGSFAPLIEECLIKKLFDDSNHAIVSLDQFSNIRIMQRFPLTNCKSMNTVSYSTLSNRPTIAELLRGLNTFDPRVLIEIVGLGLAQYILFQRPLTSPSVEDLKQLLMLKGNKTKDEVESILESIISFISSCRLKGYINGKPNTVLNQVIADKNAKYGLHHNHSILEIDSTPSVAPMNQMRKSDRQIVDLTHTNTRNSRNQLQRTGAAADVVSSGEIMFNGSAFVDDTVPEATLVMEERVGYSPSQQQQQSFSRSRFISELQQQQLYHLSQIKQNNITKAGMKRLLPPPKPPSASFLCAIEPIELPPITHLQDPALLATGTSGQSQLHRPYHHPHMLYIVGVAAEAPLSCPSDRIPPRSRAVTRERPSSLPADLICYTEVREEYGFSPSLAQLMPEPKQKKKIDSDTAEVQLQVITAADSAGLVSLAKENRSPVSLHDDILRFFAAFVEEELGIPLQHIPSLQKPWGRRSESLSRMLSLHSAGSMTESQRTVDVDSFENATASLRKKMTDTTDPSQTASSPPHMESSSAPCASQISPDEVPRDIAGILQSQQSRCDSLESSSEDLPPPAAAASAASPVTHGETDEERGEDMNTSGSDKTEIDACDVVPTVEDDASLKSLADSTHSDLSLRRTLPPSPTATSRPTDALSYSIRSPTRTPTNQRAASRLNDMIIALADRRPSTVHVPNSPNNLLPSPSTVASITSAISSILAGNEDLPSDFSPARSYISRSPIRKRPTTRNNDPFNRSESDVSSVDIPSLEDYGQVLGVNRGLESPPPQDNQGRNFSNSTAKGRQGSGVATGSEVTARQSYHQKFVKSETKDFNDHRHFPTPSADYYISAQTNRSRREANDCFGQGGSIEHHHEHLPMGPIPELPRVLPQVSSLRYRQSRGGMSLGWSHSQKSSQGTDLRHDSEAHPSTFLQNKTNSSSSRRDNHLSRTSVSSISLNGGVEYSYHSLNPQSRDALGPRDSRDSQDYYRSPSDPTSVFNPYISQTRLWAVQENSNQHCNTQSYYRPSFEDARSEGEFVRQHSLRQSQGSNVCGSKRSFVHVESQAYGHSKRVRETNQEATVSDSRMRNSFATNQYQNNLRDSRHRQYPQYSNSSMSDSWFIQLADKFASNL